jgi:hypothetical protein
MDKPWLQPVSRPGGGMFDSDGGIPVRPTLLTSLPILWQLLPRHIACALYLFACISA